MRKSWFRSPNLYYGAALISFFASAAWYVINRQIDVGITVGLALTLIFLLTAILLDPARIRTWWGGRQARYGSNALILSLAFTGILAVINFLVYENPKQWDLTEDQTYTLTPETKAVLDELDAQVQIIGFYTPSVSNNRDQIRPLLDQYSIYSNQQISYFFSDPLENPLLANQYGVTRDGTLVVVSGDSSEVLDLADEQQITEALIRIINPGTRKVYFLIGHGERDIDSAEDGGYSQLKDSLNSKNYETDTLNLLVDPAVPDDAALVVIAAPQQRLKDAEVEALKTYFAGGGALIYLTEPGLNQDGEPDPLEDYFATEMGIVLRADFVVDQSSSLPLSGISAQYAVHPITQDIQNLVTYYPTTRSLELQAPENASISQVQLVLTGSNSWGETDLEGFTQRGELQFDDQTDIQGPLALAAVAEDSESGGRAVIFGDSDFASNGFFFELGNGDMLINSIDWAVGNEQLINLTAKSQTQRFVVPPSDQTIGLIFLITVILMPGGVILLGTSIWWQRRKRV